MHFCINKFLALGFSSQPQTRNIWHTQIKRLWRGITEMIDFVDLDKWWRTHTRSCGILDWSVGLLITLHLKIVDLGPRKWEGFVKEPFDMLWDILLQMQPARERQLWRGASRVTIDHTDLTLLSPFSCWWCFQLTKHKKRAGGKEEPWCYQNRSASLTWEQVKRGESS